MRLGTSTQKRFKKNWTDIGRAVEKPNHFDAMLCKLCDSPIPASANGNQKFCGPKCKNDHERKKAKERHAKQCAEGKTKTCACCGIEKPMTEFWPKNKQCKRCKADRSREYMAKRLSDDKEFRERQRLNAFNNPRKKEYNLKSKIKRGLVKYESHVAIWRRHLKTASNHTSHVKAFQEWKRNPASMGWCARFYKRRGDPWNNPHISAAAKFKIQYRLDSAFRLYHINKAGWRRDNLSWRNDGTINFRGLLNERKTCPYCGEKITPENAVADHMDPMKLGGANSQHNLTICCRSCNRKKSGRPYLEWVAMLPEQRRGPAIVWYKRKHGHVPEQSSLTFEFAA
jgi:hypothetical protein